MNEKLSRGSVLKALAAVPAAALAIGYAHNEAEAAAKSPQSAVQYQNKPKNGVKCAQCRFYLANKKSPKADGACSVVAGKISPNGWCVVYSPKT